MNVRKDSCNSLPIHFLDFLKVISGSNADDAGQLLEFVFAAILSSQAKTACVKLALYFCCRGGVRGSLPGFTRAPPPPVKDL